MAWWVEIRAARASLLLLLGNALDAASAPRPAKIICLPENNRERAMQREYAL